LASPQPNATIPLLLASPGAAQKTPKATSRSLCRPDTGTSADSLTRDAGGAWRVELQAACHACPRELKRAAWMSGFLMEETLFV
jgi:hypothetical protein